jgi:hypothetical protein
VGKLVERDHLENPGVDRRILLRWMYSFECVNWIELAQDRGSK